MGDPCGWWDGRFNAKMVEAVKAKITEILDKEVDPNGIGERG